MKVRIAAAAFVMLSALCMQTSFAQQAAPVFYPPVQSSIKGISYVFRTSPQSDASGETKASVATISIVVVMRHEATPLPHDGAGMQVTYARNCTTGDIIKEEEAFDTNGAPLAVAASEVVVEQIRFLVELSDSDKRRLREKCVPPPPPQKPMGQSVYPVSSVDVELKFPRYLKAEEWREPVVHTAGDALRWMRYRDEAIDRARDTSGGRYVITRYMDVTSVVDLTHQQAVGDLTRIVVYSAIDANSRVMPEIMTPNFDRYSALVSCERKTAIVEDRSVVTITGAATSLELLGDREYPLGGASLGKAYARVCELDPSGKEQQVFDNLQVALAEAARLAATPP